MEAFRIRPLDAGSYTFVAADVLVIKAREGGRWCLTVWLMSDSPSMR